MSAGFAGFSPEALAFLDELHRHDKQWFDANRDVYDTGLAAPAKAFVEPVAEALRAAISHGIEGVARVNGSIAPINNDVRFSADKTPYRDYLMFKWWEGPDKKLAPTLMVRLTSGEVGFASGVALPGGVIDRWRELVAADATGSQLAAAINALVGATGAEVVGADYKRVPKPYPADHPREDLLRHKWLQIRWAQPLPDEATSAAFADWCGDRLSLAGDLHRWLVANL